jgi:hypothetical protein
MRLLLGCGLILLTIPSLANAADIHVTVFGIDAKPAAKVQVCVGTQMQRALFGMKRTAADGTVQFTDLPEGKVYITADDGSRGKEVGVVTIFSSQSLLALPRRLNEIRCSQKNKVDGSQS